MGEKVNGEEQLHGRNWKHLSEKQIEKLHPIQRSKYLAYVSPGDEIGLMKAKARLLEEQKKKRIFDQERKLSNDYHSERKQRDVVLGQLKASEACNRVKALRSQYQSNRTTEINHLISTQPTAIKAVRLKSLLPPQHTKKTFKDTVAEAQRIRIEELMEDELGLETGRILS